MNEFTDYSLHIEEPEGSCKKRYTIRTMDNKVLGVRDLAARVGRDVNTLYDMFRNFPPGIHTANFQDMLRISAGRKYRRFAERVSVIRGTHHAAKLEHAFTFMRCEPTCALARHLYAEHKARAAYDRYIDELKLWAHNDKILKSKRAEGEHHAAVLPPVQPREPGLIVAPACDCGRAAALKAARESIDECEVRAEEAGAS